MRYRTIGYTIQRRNTTSKSNQHVVNCYLKDFQLAFRLSFVISVSHFSISFISIRFWSETSPSFKWPWDRWTEWAKCVRMAFLTLEIHRVSVIVECYCWNHPRNSDVMELSFLWLSWSGRCHPIDSESGVFQDETAIICWKQVILTIFRILSNSLWWKSRGELELPSDNFQSFIWEQSTLSVFWAKSVVICPWFIKAFQILFLFLCHSILRDDSYSQWEKVFHTRLCFFVDVRENITSCCSADWASR
jgi:hypothetical protein